MSDHKAQEYLAKEAESLERAKLTDDEDLKHLHETIAKQWHLLAQGIEPNPFKKRAGRRPTTKTVTSSRYKREAAGARPTAGHANSQHSITSVAGHSAVEPPPQHRRRTRSKTITRNPRSA
jgi:hypothetical protein